MERPRASDVAEIVVDVMLIAYLALLIRGYVRSSPMLQAEIASVRARAAAEARRMFVRIRPPVSDEDVFAAHEKLARMTTLGAIE